MGRLPPIMQTQMPTQRNVAMSEAFGKFVESWSEVSLIGPWATKLICPSVILRSSFGHPSVILRSPDADRFPLPLCFPGVGVEWAGKIPALKEEPSRAKLFVGHASLIDSERIRVLLRTTKCTALKNSIKFRSIMCHDQDDVLSIHKGS